MLSQTEAYSEPSQTSKMELIAKIINWFQALTIFAIISISYVRLGSEYSSVKCLKEFQNFVESLYIQRIGELIEIAHERNECVRNAVVFISNDIIDSLWDS